MSWNTSVHHYVTEMCRESQGTETIFGCIVLKFIDNSRIWNVIYTDSPSSTGSTYNSKSSLVRMWSLEFWTPCLSRDELSLVTLQRCEFRSDLHNLTRPNSYFDNPAIIWAVFKRASVIPHSNLSEKCQAIRRIEHSATSDDKIVWI